MKRKSYIAIIPARKNSKRLKNKNKTLLWGEPLISWSIKAAMNAEYVDAVFVSSDCHTILEIAKELGASVIKRPASLSLNSIPKQKVIKTVVGSLANKKKICFLAYLCSNCCIDYFLLQHEKKPRST